MIEVGAAASCAGLVSQRADGAVRAAGARGHSALPPLPAGFLAPPFGFGLSAALPPPLPPPAVLLSSLPLSLAPAVADAFR